MWLEINYGGILSLLLHTPALCKRGNCGMSEQGNTGMGASTAPEPVSSGSGQATNSDIVASAASAGMGRMCIF